jgi:DNA polymerase III delta prime subunit
MLVPLSLGLCSPVTSRAICLVYSPVPKDNRTHALVSTYYYALVSMVSLLRVCQSFCAPNGGFPGEADFSWRYWDQQLTPCASRHFWHRSRYVPHTVNPHLVLITMQVRVLKKWMNALAGSPNIPEISKADVAIDNLRHQILNDQNFRECLLNLKKTVVLEGTPGVGKTTAILAIIDQLKQNKRQQDHDQKHDQGHLASQTSEGSFAKLVSYVKEIVYCLCSAATRLIVRSSLLQRLIALVLDVTYSPIPSQQQIPKERLESISSVLPIAVLFSAEKKEEQTSTKTLGFLLVQLVQQIPEAFSHVHGLYRTFKETGTDPPASDLEDTIITIIKGHPVCLFLDALDECSVDFLEELLPRIKRIQDQTEAGIVFTDRINQSKQTWKRCFPSAIMIPMWAENGDIDAYIEIRLTKMANRTERVDHWLYDETSRAGVKKVIVQASGRMYVS